MAFAQWLGGMLLAALCAMHPSPAQAEEAGRHPMPRTTALIPLPDARTASDVALETTLRHRRSVREFTTTALTLQDAGQILWAAQGITSREGFRTAPSAGALYPLEVFLVAGHVEELEAGVYHYVPRKHALERTAEGDAREGLARAAAGQDWITTAPALLLVTALYERTRGKYGQRAVRYVQMEAGHVAQNVYLQATALGLGTCMVGAFDDAAVQAVLQLPAQYEPLALLPVGHPR